MFLAVTTTLCLCSLCLNSSKSVVCLLCVSLLNIELYLIFFFPDMSWNRISWCNDQTITFEQKLEYHRKTGLNSGEAMEFRLVSVFVQTSLCYIIAIVCIKIIVMICFTDIM